MWCSILLMPGVRRGRHGRNSVIPVMRTLVSTCAIPESPNDTHSDAGVFFRESARTVFVALLEKLPQKDPHALPKLLRRRRPIP